MSSRAYRNILQFGLAALMIFAPVAKGAVELWSQTIAEVAVFVLVFAWLWHANNSNSQAKDTKIRRTKIDLPIWLFVILAAASCVPSVYKYASMLEMSRLIAVVGLFYLAVNNFDRYLVVRFSTLIILIATAISFFGFGQYFLNLNHSWWAHDRFLSSTFVNHNHFAGYLELAFPLAVGLVLGLKRKDVSSDFKYLVFKFLLSLAIIIMGIAFILSQSRAGWASLLVALVIMNIILIKKKALTKLSLIIFLVLILVSVIYVYVGHDAVATRLRTVEEINQESFLEGRHKIWEGAINMIKKYPLVGTGIGTFVWAMPAFRPEGLNVRAFYAHNDYLHMMAEMGVLALPLMLWIIFSTIALGIRGRTKENSDKKNKFELMDGIILGCAIGILSLTLHGLVDFNFHITSNVFLMAAFAGLIMRRTAK